MFLRVIRSASLITYVIGYGSGTYLYISHKFDVLIIRGREPGGAPRAEGERMSADECKQHDCNQNTFVCSQKCTKLKHIKVFCNFLQSSFLFLLKR